MKVENEVLDFDINRYLLDANETIKETNHEFWERKERRIETSKRPSTVNLIKAVERAYENEYPDDACDKICRILKTQVQSKVKYFSNRARYGGLRLYTDDFEEVFWKVVLVMIWYDYDSRSDFWLYENIFKKIDSVAIDLIRWAKRDCRKHDYMALSIDAMVDIPDPSTSQLEEDVANSDLIEQMMMDSTLNERERSLLRYLYDKPDASFQEIANDLNLKHKETARRVMVRLRKKLYKYKQYL
jgi:DNA-directed RNA polymerase specialized sigma24 family protein